MFKKLVLSVFVLVCFCTPYVGTAQAVSLQASEGFVLKIPNADLNLNSKVQKAPKVRLQREGRWTALTVSDFIPGTDGNVLCAIPSGLTPGHYSLWSQNNGKWVKSDTLVKVFAPIVTSITVNGGIIQSGAAVDMEGLFFSNAPTVSIHYQVTGNAGLQSIAQNCTTLDSSSVMDAETGAGSLQIQIPQLQSNDIISCSFEIKSPNGSAFIYYSNADNAVNKRGRLISATMQNTVKKKDVWDYLVKALGGDYLYKQILTAGCLWKTKLWNQKYQYDLQLWNITYETIDANGGKVVASGVVIVPQGITQLSLLSFQHGTMLMKKEAPTLSDGPELALAATFATTDGFLASVPDHLGLGQAAYRTQKDLLHPYCEAQPLAIGAADMMIAVKSFMTKQFPTLQLKNKLFLAGYSEGAYATMALHRELDTIIYDLPPVTASACMDGPYSLSKVMLDALMADKQFPVLYFAPYVLVTLDRIYQIYNDDSEYMTFPYDMTVAPLINGYFSSDVVNSEMPASGKPRDLLLPAVVTELSQYTGKIYTVMATNDLAPTIPPQGAWKPTAPIYLIHGERDDCVPYGNTTYAANYFTAVQATNVKVGSFDTIFASIPGMTKHVIYCPFAMGIAWDWLHNQSK